MASDLERLDRQRREALARAEAAEAKLAAFRALCDRDFNMEDYYEIDANDVAAILDAQGNET